MPQTVFVTGAAGLIGHEAVRWLAARQYHGLHAVIHRAGLDGGMPVTIVRADLTAPVAIAPPPPPAAVVHCAARIPASFADEPAAEAAAVNRRIDDHVIEWCAANGIRLIYCSSTSVVLHPSNAYSRAKRLSEERIRQSVDSHAILRINAPYGPRQTANTVLKVFVANALAGMDLVLYGSGARQQMFVHVTDAAAAIEAAMNATVTGTFDVAGGECVTMHQLAETVLSVIPGTGSRIVFANQPDAMEAIAPAVDLERTRTALNWRPAVSLRDGIVGMAAAGAVS